MDLQEIVCSDAERNNKNETEMKTAFFSVWKQQKAYEATYGKLVYALEMIGNKKDAVAVCMMLAKSLGKPTSEQMKPTGIVVAVTGVTIVYAVHSLNFFVGRSSLRSC